MRWRWETQGILLVSILVSFLFSSPALAQGFKDISPVPWAAPSIDLLAAQGAVEGTSTTTFDPEGPITREALSVLLSRMFGVTQRADLSTFPDSRQVDAWALPGVEEAVAASWVKGEGQFLDPLGPVTRAQAATLLARAFKVSGTPASLTYLDSPSIPSWAVSAVAILSQDGVLKGEPGNLFDPNAPVTRAQFAVMLARSEPLATSLPGLPNAVFGRVGSWIAPNDPSLAISSTVAGPGGGFTLSTGKLDALNAGAPVAFGPLTGDLYSLSPGDPVAGVIGAGGDVGLLLDFSPLPGGGDAVIENASDHSLYLSDGEVVPVATTTVPTLFGSKSGNLPPAALVGATVAMPLPPSGEPFQLASLELVGLSGQVTSTSSTGFTLNVLTSPSPFLSPGPLGVATDTTTALQAGGQSVQSLPPVGSTVTVVGRLTVTGTFTAKVVIW